MKTWTYIWPSIDPVEDTTTVDLEDGGDTVFGVLKTTNGDDYEVFGYHRMSYLVMFYGGVKLPGGGTLALQGKIANGQSLVFWGWVNSIECVGPDSYIVQCPALMYKKGSVDPTPMYSKFFQKDHCRKMIQDEPPELCEDLKANK